MKSVLIGTVNFIATDRNAEQVTTGMITGEFNLDVRIVDVESGEVVSTAGATKNGSQTYRSLMPKLAEDIASKIFGSNGNVTVLLGYLYVFPEDLGNFKYYEARGMCENVNNVNLYGYNDWRFPSTDELKLIFQNRAKIEGLTNGFYLSNYHNDSYSYSIVVSFSDGKEYREDGENGYVRLVRTNK